MSKQIRFFALFFVLYETTVYLSNDMVMPGMLQVVSQFHASIDNIALSLSLYIIGGSSLQIFLGPLADTIGKRRVLLFGNGLFIIATFIIALSGSINQFLIARFFQGFGLCFIFIGYALIHDLLDDVRAVSLIAILVNVSLLAPLLGPVLGNIVLYYYNWRYIFLLTSILSIITFIGLSRYMPKHNPLIKHKIDLKDIVRTYKAIFTNKMFILGLSSYGIGMLPIISWIGISPVIIMNTMHKSQLVYILDQSIIFGGFTLSCILINQIAGKFKFSTIINGGNSLALIGIIIAYVFNSFPMAFVMGMFLFSFGFGLFCGSIIRISLISTGKSMNLTSAAMSLIVCLCLSGGLMISNEVCSYFGYTLKSLSTINLIAFGLSFMGNILFAKYNKNRQWN